MTFYEAALRILEGAGHPLHVQEITEKSIAQNLLSHVGKTPEQTMLSRLAAMARRNRDRRMIITARDTFGLIEWGLAEDPEALAVTGVPAPNPEEDLPPLRPAERHPEPRGDFLRAGGRPSERSDRKRRYPPLSEVAFEILSQHGAALSPGELLAKGKEKALCGEELEERALLAALVEDNQRRIDAGRRPQFCWVKESGQLLLERSDAPFTQSPSDVQLAFADALGIPFENGRPVLRPPPPEPSAVEVADVSALKATLKEVRRTMARTLRKRLSELDAFTFEKASVRMLQAHGFREIKVAKRNNLGPLMTARKREGNVDLRYAIRLVKGSAPVDRKQVQDLRRDVGGYAAHVGMLLSAGEPRGDARGEAGHSGALTLLYCGDALAEKYFEAKAGVVVQTVELYEVDERFFETAKTEAEETARRREERQRTKAQQPKPARPSPEAAPAESIAAGEASPLSPAAESESLEGAGEEQEEGFGEPPSAQEVAPVPGGPSPEGEQRRRRRRRRRRKGRLGPGEPAIGAAASATPTTSESAAPAPEKPPAE